MLRKLLTPILVAALLVAALTLARAADTLRKYSSDSAHGSATSGVHRTSLPESPSQAYATGNCAHCHEQHASVNDSEPTPAGGSGYYAVFKSGLGNSDNFCFGCHTTSGGQQAVTNYNYSRRFGGHAGSTVASIRDAFPTAPGALGSAPSGHNLASIATWAYVINSSSNPWGWVKDGSTNTTNPCLACHDVHRSMQTSGPPSWDSSKANLILPQAHNRAYADNLYGHLWGDENEQRSITRIIPTGTVPASVYERQSDLAANWPASPSETRAYQSPNSLLGGYEDGGTGDGSSQPNYTELCLACHRLVVTGVVKIKYDKTIVAANREMHGLAEEEFPCAGSGGWGDLRPPYVTTSGEGYPSPPGTCTDTKRNKNYIVGCLDCHEPHGSALPYMLREEVNGHVVNPALITSTNLKDFCIGCHDWSYLSSPHQNMMSNCKDCHYHSRNDSSNHYF
jgi:predicted CXXCH cytochrome family protein